MTLTTPTIHHSGRSWLSGAERRVISGAIPSSTEWTHPNSHASDELEYMCGALLSEPPNDPRLAFIIVVGGCCLIALWSLLR